MGTIGKMRRKTGQSEKDRKTGWKKGGGGKGLGKKGLASGERTEQKRRTRDR